MSRKSLLLVVMAVALAMPFTSFAAQNANVVTVDQTVVTKIQNMAIAEYMKSAADTKKENVEAFISKISNGLYVVDAAKVNEGNIQDAVSYKIQADPKTGKIELNAASLEDKLFALELAHWSYASVKAGQTKDEVKNEFAKFNSATGRLFAAMSAEIEKDPARASATIDSYIAYVKTKNAPAVFAFQPLTKSLLGKLKFESLKQSSPEAAGLLKASCEKTGELLKAINAKPAQAKAPEMNIDLGTDVSKHYDPTHPGHVHQSSNGTIYNQPGDNGPFSHGSYNTSSHHGHSSHHPSYPTYPTTPTYPPTYYPPQYPTYPAPTYPAPTYPQYNPYPGQIEHIHHCARCRREFSYYPNGYAPTCPYCGYYGY